MWRWEWAVWATWFSCLFLTSGAMADQVIFKNGDRITGTIKSAADGKLVIDTENLGTVIADFSKISTFSTSQPITLQLSDGRELKLPVAPATQGSIAVESAGLTPIDQITRINPVPPVLDKWTGALRAGALVTRGNSETENFNINFDATRRTPKHRITTGAGYFFGRQRDPDTGEDNTTTDNWFAFGKYDYFWTPRFYSYFQTRVEQDRVAALELRVIPGVGVGYQWYDTPTFKFSTEAGVDWVYERYEEGGSSEHFAARAAYRIEKRLNDKVTLFHNLEYRPSFYEISDYNINADAGIRASIYKNLFTEFKVEWRFDSTPAPGASDSDLRYLLMLGWTF